MEKYGSICGFNFCKSFRLLLFDFIHASILSLVVLFFLGSISKDKNHKIFQKMSKVTLFIATTLDGKIARKNGELDWLMNRPNPNQLDFGYHEFLGKVGAIVLGKTTYKEILGFGIEWPYTGIPAYVATTDPKFQPKTPDTFTLTTDLTEFVADLRQKITKDIWLMGGGQLISTFLKKDLLDRMILTLIPTTIGEGIPLFPEISKETKWALTHVEHFETGVVNLTYDKEIYHA